MTDKEFLDDLTDRTAMHTGLVPMDVAEYNRLFDMCHRFRASVIERFTGPGRLLARHTELCFEIHCARQRLADRVTARLQS